MSGTSRSAWIVAGTAAAMLAAAVVYALRPTPPVPQPPEVPKPAAPTPGPIQLHEVTGETGVDFLHTDGSSGRRYILEAMSAGVATFDYDGDGLIDIYFPNGAPLPGTKGDGPPPRHALYKNLGNWRFRDVTLAAGLGSNAYGLGVAVGDYDNDGHPDLYLNNFGPNQLYRNNGDGTFTDVTQKAGVARGDQVGAGVCFLDADGDGDLDLYVGSYITLKCEEHVPHMAGPFPSYPSPTEYAPVPDTLYRNNGDGTFADVSRESGVAAVAGRSMGMVAADYDGDGDTDVFVLNDVQENFLFVNDGRGKFQEKALLLGAAVNGMGEILANMGTDCGDFDNDGRLDFFSTNYQNQWPLLLRNLGGGMLEDVTRPAGAGAGCFPHVNWGCGLVDLDNDGWRDLFVVNGHTEDNIEDRDPSGRYKAPNVVLRNVGGKFVDVTAGAGDGLSPIEASRGAAFDDLDNDGDVDAVILNSRSRPTILRNMAVERGGANHWIQVRLRGVTANRDGVGSRVTVKAGDLTLIDEVHSGRGYQSHWGTRLHFGLGRRDRVDRVEVRWLGGGTTVVEDLSGDRLVTIDQGGEQRKQE